MRVEVGVTQPDAHMNIAIEIEGPQITALQLVWADARGRMPWERGFRQGRYAQRVSGVRTGLIPR